MHAFTGTGDGGIGMGCNRNRGIIVRYMPSPGQEREESQWAVIFGLSMYLLELGFFLICSCTCPAMAT